MSDVWYYSVEGKAVGPLSLADLTTILSHISNAKDVIVWQSGFEHWKRAADVPELAAFVIKPPPLPPVPPPLPPSPPALPREPLKFPVAAKDHEDHSRYQEDRADGLGFSYYKTALYLTSAIALIEVNLFFYLAPHNLKVSFGRVAIAPVVLFGLWIQSNVARYLGAIFFLILVASVILLLFTLDKVSLNIVTILVLVSGVLSLFVIYILLLSKQFATEFSYQQKGQPKYKNYLRRIFIVVVVLVVAIATANDIYHLAVEP
jgi:GYF domain 2